MNMEMWQQLGLFCLNITRYKCRRMIKHLHCIHMRANRIYQITYTLYVSDMWSPLCLNTSWNLYIVVLFTSTRGLASLFDNRGSGWHTLIINMSYCFDLNRNAAINTRIWLYICRGALKQIRFYVTYNKCIMSTRGIVCNVIGTDVGI